MSSHAVKRITAELKDQQKNPSKHFIAEPRENDLFDWHFTLRGPEDTPFAEGLYHGRIILSTSYPLKPPKFLMMTPNGRFEIFKEICMSMTDYHPEAWNPSWSIRSMLEAVVSFLPEDSIGVGAIQVSEATRKKMAKNSVKWTCDSCRKSNAELWEAHEKLVKEAAEMFKHRISDDEQIKPVEEEPVIEEESKEAPPEVPKTLLATPTRVDAPDVAKPPLTLSPASSLLPPISEQAPHDEHEQAPDANPTTAEEAKTEEAAAAPPAPEPRQPNPNYPTREEIFAFIGSTNKHIHTLDGILVSVILLLLAKLYLDI
jgi:ubiquitin-conjugating enzyme E2 J1